MPTHNHSYNHSYNHQAAATDYSRETLVPEGAARATSEERPAEEAPSAPQDGPSDGPSVASGAHHQDDEISPNPFSSVTDGATEKATESRQKESAHPESAHEFADQVMKFMKKKGTA